MLLVDDVSDEVDAEADLQLVQVEHLADALRLRDLPLLSLEEEAVDEVQLVRAVVRDPPGPFRPLDRQRGLQTDTVLAKIIGGAPSVLRHG